MKNRKKDPDVAPVAPAAQAQETAAPAVISANDKREAFLDRVITVLAAKNPKKAGTKCFGWFELYRSGMTVREYYQARGKAAAGDLRWDTRHGFIKVS